ncbi:TPA: hypothetical protein DF272_02410 [Candidatus Falkowbacteria bacterium]|nr:hypothetical protein [Candidatus Falkowbacteria bacterium]
MVNKNHTGVDELAARAESLGTSLYNLYELGQLTPSEQDMLVDHFGCVCLIPGSPEHSYADSPWSRYAGTTSLRDFDPGKLGRLSKAARRELARWQK